MEDLPLGCCFKPTDNDILIYLRYYVTGQPRPSGFIVEYDHVNNFQVEQPPDVRMLGCLGSLYCYAACFFRQESGQIKRQRNTYDGRGNVPIEKRPFMMRMAGLPGTSWISDFVDGKVENEASTTWVMTEYTLEPNSSTNNQYAICVLWNTREA